MIKPHFKIATQKKDTNDCGAIAVINLLRFYNQKSPSLRSLLKRLKKNKDGIHFHNISIFLDSKNYKYNKVYNPNIKKMIPRIKNGGSIILFNSKGTSNHYSMILKITKKYVYLTNMFNEETGLYESIAKIKIDSFLKYRFISIIFF